MQRIILLFSVLIFVSCGNSQGVKSEVSEQLFLGLHSEDDPLPEQAYTFNADLMFYNMTDEDKVKMDKAVEIIKKVIATEEFRSKVLNHTYQGQKRFADNRGHNNSQIYQKILDGAEKIYPRINNSMDAEVELFYASSNVVGYTFANSPRIWVNTKYFNHYTAAGVAHNLFHEWMHKLGYEHDSKISSSRDYTVPYALGFIVGEIGQKFL